MPKGFPTPDEKKEQAIALAHTSMTQEQIAEKVGISRRQVVRIWDKARVSRDRKHISISEGKEDDAATRYSEVLRDRHIQELIHLAGEIYKYLTVPFPCEATAWYSRIAPQLIGWRLPGLLCFSIEGFTLSDKQQALVPYLQAHMDDPGFWRDLEALDEEAIKYCYHLHGWIQILVYDAYRYTGLPLLTPGQEGQPGLTPEFFDTVLRLASFQDRDDPWAGLNNLHYDTGGIEGGLTGLTFGHWQRSTIAWAPEDDHGNIIDVHKNLIAKMTGEFINKLIDEHTQVETCLVKLRERLLPSIIGIRIAGGHCDLCP